MTSLSENPRGLSGDGIYDLVEDKTGLVVENDMIKAFEKAKKLERKVIVVCGSFYTLSKFKEEING